MAVAALFPDWRQAVSTLGVGFAEVCRGLVEEWRACRERAETARVEISRLEVDLEGKRATLKAAEAASLEAAQQLSAKQCDLDKLVAERLTVIGGRPVGAVRTEYQERSETAEKAWHAAEMVRSTAEQHAVAMASHVVGARHACDVARSEHASAERLLEDKLMACEITRAQADPRSPRVKRGLHPSSPVSTRCGKRSRKPPQR